VENVFIELKAQNVNTEEKDTSMAPISLIENALALIEINWNLEVF
jgi:hypothetical protein